MRYKVYIEQINQTYVEVEAESEEEARSKGRRLWREQEAIPYVLSVEPCEGEDND